MMIIAPILIAITAIIGFSTGYERKYECVGFLNKNINEKIKGHIQIRIKKFNYITYAINKSFGSDIGDGTIYVHPSAEIKNLFWYQSINFDERDPFVQGNNSKFNDKSVITNIRFNTSSNELELLTRAGGFSSGCARIE